MANPAVLCVVFAAVTWLAAGCSPIVANRGNLVDEDRLAAIQEGVSRKDEVAAILGSPTATGTFDGSVWYYIGQITEASAFSRPQAIERKVLVLKFDQADTVASKKLLTLADGQEIDMNSDATPTAGREMGFFEQFLGNIGRFSGGAGQGRTGPGAPVGR